jgi:hypothetical protein
LIIVHVLSGYKYLDILLRRDILMRKMEAEVKSTGRALGKALEKILLPGRCVNQPLSIIPLGANSRVRKSNCWAAGGKLSLGQGGEESSKGKGSKEDIKLL